MTFFPDTIKQWNVVIADFSEMPDLTTFKNHLLSFYRPKPKRIFGIHDPTGVKYLFQLRLGLSPLRSHKKRHNFLDTPTDDCLCKTGKETTEHFLFACPFYTLKRIPLAEQVVPLLPPHNLAFLQNDVNLYLYGHEKLPENDNRIIILSTIKFIKDSNRFNWSFFPAPSPPLHWPWTYVHISLFLSFTYFLLPLSMSFYVFLFFVCPYLHFLF